MPISEKKFRKTGKEAFCMAGSMGTRAESEQKNVRPFLFFRAAVTNLSVKEKENRWL